MYNNKLIIENNISSILINKIFNFSKNQRDTYQDKYLKKIMKEKKKSNNNLNKILKILFNNHDYDSMLNMLSLMKLNKKDEEKIISVIEYYRNWDLFEYDELNKYVYKGLPNIFQPINEKHLENIKALKKLSTKYKDYRLVIDLINNAKRRNREGKYNEAIIQLYRALELSCHLKLKKNYGIDSANVDLKQLEKLRVNKYFIEYLKGFTNSYNHVHVSLKDQLYILKQLKDPIGKFYQENQDIFCDIIEMRHSSLLVHGNTNITLCQYQEYEYIVKEVACKLNKKIRKYLKLSEFPEFEI